VKRNRVFNALIGLKRKFIESIRPSDTPRLSGTTTNEKRGMIFTDQYAVGLHCSIMAILVVSASTRYKLGFELDSDTGMVLVSHRGSSHA